MFTSLILDDKKRMDISKISTSNEKVLYKFELCGHYVEYSASTNVTNGARCPDCYKNRIKTHAQDLGLTLIDENTKGNREYLFKFNSCGHIKSMQASKVLTPYRDGVSCGDCQIELFKEDAAKREFEYLSPANATFGKNYYNYKLYKCNKCGAEDYHNLGHMRRGTARCGNCFTLTISNDLNGVGLTYVSHDTNSNYFVKAPLCGHTFSLSLNNIRSRETDYCPVCLKETFQSRLTHLGLSPTGEADGRNKTYKINACGHEIVLRSDVINKGNFQCKECFDNKFNAEISVFGLKQTNRKSGKGFRWLLLPCGCEQEVGMFSARVGKVYCKTCDETFYNKKSSIYLLKFEVAEFSWLKFGFSKSVDNRVVGYGLPSGYSSLLLKAVEIPTGYMALKIEKKIHTIYKEYRLNPEMMRTFHSKNGFTECYPIDMEKILLDELNGLIIEQYNN